jgi:hypothetical protein
VNFTLNSEENVNNVMRNCGYFFDRADDDQHSYIRTLGASRSGYPRFHIYVKFNDVSREIEVSLHLDQKKPIYEGVRAHSGEYDGGLVQGEAQRIKDLVGTIKFAV